MHSSTIDFQLTHNIPFYLAVQYYRRGFDPYVLDQNCQHEAQCISGPFAVEGQAGIVDGVHHDDLPPRNGATIDNDELTSFQDQNGRISCCCGETKFPYSLVLFEKQQGEGLEFFATLYGWCDLKIASLNSLHPWHRVACRKCRYKYENYAFMKRNSYSTDSVDDLLCENNAYVGSKVASIFAPSFYSGGVFDSERVFSKLSISGRRLLLCRASSRQRRPST
jgi:hypothetical protein